ncbi:MAG: hypothetical protein NC319_08135 [Butyricicoccus sp.]|nr:hypothetical protein [Butyricicoccus sp.]
MKRSIMKRALALTLTVIMAAGLCSTGVCAAGIKPDCDETYYATLDYYGAITDSSVVKSYRTYGSSTITDYGSYSSVVNLSDGRAPVMSDGKVSFDLSGDVPDRFYFEGKTEQPYEDFPWSLSLGYKLNGVPTPAERLCGEKGVVEITLDAVPNLKASEYSRNNLVLMAASVFSGDEILSLEAPGAQVQLLGNLYAVIYAVLPGEEQHFTISVGSDDFSYGGMVFMAMPATLAQLEQIAELRGAKEDAEGSYRSISDSLDAVLDSMDGMSGSLSAAANGLDSLNYARGAVSAGKEQVYGSVDAALEAAGELTGGMEPISGHLGTAAQAVTDTKNVLNDMNDNLTGLRPDVANIKKALERISRDLNDLDGAMNGGGDNRALEDIMESMSGDLQAMSDSLGVFSGRLEGAGVDQITEVDGPDGPVSVSEIRAGLAQVDAICAQAGIQDATAFQNAVTAMVQAGQITPEQAQMLVYLYTNRDDIEKQLDTLDKVNGALGGVNDSVGAITAPAGKVVGEIQDLTGTLKNLNDTLAGVAGEAGVGGMDQLVSASANVCKSIDAALEQLDGLNGILDTYEPELQTSLSEAQAIAGSAEKALGAVTGAVSATENLLRQSGGSLDAGTRQTLSSLASLLRQSTAGLEQTDSIRLAKDELDALISEQWDSHTGEDNNLLLMDANAAPESLTDSRNEGTASIQYVMRSREITEGSSAQEDSGAERQSGQGTFWSRVKQMFQDIWNAIKSVF